MKLFSTDTPSRFSIPMVLTTFALTTAFALSQAHAREATPEELFEEWESTVANPTAPINDRTVLPEQFSEYGIVVDVFRGSKINPVIGNYQNEYHDVLNKNVRPELDESSREEQIKNNFSSLAELEFAITSIDGVPTEAHVISAALEKSISLPVKDNNRKPIINPVTGKPYMAKSFKTTPAGNYKLTPVMMSVTDTALSSPLTLPYPWIKSYKFDDSPMFWGLWIHHGFFIHSTPHYSHLGHPASMGCIRQSFPDAMAMFDLIANRTDGKKAMIRIHKMDSQSAVDRLNEILTSPLAIQNSKNKVWLVDLLNTNFYNVGNYVSAHGNDYFGTGHAWIDPTSGIEPVFNYPSCAGVDCFKYWPTPIQNSNKLH